MILIKNSSTEAKFKPIEATFIRQNLLTWYHQHRRHLPWRGDSPPFTSSEDVLNSTKLAISNQNPHHPSTSSISVTNQTTPRATPYSSWVSEIMLQQTRVDTVIQYHTTWMTKFPNLQSLAEASEEDVNKYWAGLGFYRRARYLHKGAKYVVEKYNGKLPMDVKTLQTIPGIGPYTAGAISSIAFNQYEPLVDGNVIRVLSRLRALGGRAKNKALVETCWVLARDLVQKTKVEVKEKEEDDGVVVFHPGDFNQSIMELGATICSPKVPKCHLCPIQQVCRAYSEVNHLYTLGDAPTELSSSTTSTSASSSSSSSGKASIVIDYAEDDEERELNGANVRAKFVTKYPYPKKKIKIKEENWNVTVVEWKKRKNESETILKQNENDTESLFLLLKRPPTGLLAGQWEFPSVMNGSGGDGSVAALLPTCSIGLETVIGTKTHVFSHIKHHMKVLKIVVSYDEQDKLLNGMVPVVNHQYDHVWMTLKDLKESRKGAASNSQIESPSKRSSSSNSSSSSGSDGGGGTIALTTGMRKVLTMFETRNDSKIVKKRKKKVVPVPVGTKTISSYFSKRPKK